MAKPPVDNKLDPHQGIIEARVEEFPRFSAKRLYDELWAAGHTGRYVRVTYYARSVQPRELVQTVVRFETPAGWHYAEHRVLVSQRWTRLSSDPYRPPFSVVCSCRLPLTPAHCRPPERLSP